MGEPKTARSTMPKFPLVRIGVDPPEPPGAPGAPGAPPGPWAPPCRMRFWTLGVRRLSVITRRLMSRFRIVRSLISLLVMEPLWMSLPVIEPFWMSLPVMSPFATAHVPPPIRDPSSSRTTPLSTFARIPPPKVDRPRARGTRSQLTARGSTDNTRRWGDLNSCAPAHTWARSAPCAAREAATATRARSRSGLSARRPCAGRSHLLAPRTINSRSHPSAIAEVWMATPMPPAVRPHLDTALGR